MKKTDLALIIIIVTISAGLSYWIASMTIGQSSDQPIVVRTVEGIQTDNITVDETVFAKNAINPTVEATISGQDITSFIDDIPEEEDGEEAAASNDPSPSGE